MNRVTSISGRVYYRHPDDHGSVMVWIDSDGSERNTLILDAKYRKLKYWAVENEHIEGLESCIDGYGYLGEVGAFCNPKISKQEIISTYGFDNALNKADFFKDPNSSSYNTDCMINNELSNLRSLAAGYCRSIGCDLPNIQTLVRIFCDGPTIDALDPTVPLYRSQSLTVKNGGWFGNNIIPFAWSSSEHDYYYPWVVMNSGLIGTVGKCDMTGGVIPVLDL